jgi:nucleotide-binding universal stress UspA family protein
VYRKILVSFDESPEAQKAFTSALYLARQLGSELHVVAVVAELPAYTVFAAAGNPQWQRALEQDQAAFYKNLAAKAHAHAAEAGLTIHTHIKDGSPVDTIVACVREIDADLLVVGLHHRDLYIARLWSTVYELAQRTPCSVLGVHRGE